MKPCRSSFFFVDDGRRQAVHVNDAQIKHFTSFSFAFFFSLRFRLAFKRQIDSVRSASSVQGGNEYDCMAYVVSMGLLARRAMLHGVRCVWMCVCRLFLVGKKSNKTTAETRKGCNVTMSTVDSINKIDCQIGKRVWNSQKRHIALNSRRYRS